MNPQTWALVIAVTGAVGGVAGYLHERDERVRNQAMREVALARADSAVAVADSLEAVADAAAREVEEAQAHSDSVREAARDRIELVRRARPEIVERIVRAPDTTAVRARVEELQASHSQEVVSLETALSAADSVIHAQAGQITAQERAMAQLRTALAAARDVQAVGGSGRGWIERTLPKVGWAAAGLAVGYLAGGGL